MNQEKAKSSPVKESFIQENITAQGDSVKEFHRNLWNVMTQRFAVNQKREDEIARALGRPLTPADKFHLYNCGRCGEQGAACACDE